jgi:hypothetical protein
MREAKPEKKKTIESSVIRRRWGLEKDMASILPVFENADN